MNDLLQRLPRFSLIFTMVVLMVMGVALIPLLDIDSEPRARQGQTLYISFAWPDASAKVVEQNVTSRIEGVVAGVRGVESVESESRMGGGTVTVQLKEQADVSAARFEISSMLKQIRRRLPEGVSYPTLSGGDVVTGQRRQDETTLLMTYLVNGHQESRRLKQRAEDIFQKPLSRIEGVRQVEVTGGKEQYVEITYDPLLLDSYGLTAGDLTSGIRAFLGRQDLVGDVLTEDGHRIALYLTTGDFSRRLEEMPVKVEDGKIVYLNDLATCKLKDREPDSYFRVNGMETVYLNIYADPRANLLRLSREVQHEVETLQGQDGKSEVWLSLQNDSSDEKQGELHRLVRYSLLSLAILLLFVLAVRREWRYLTVIAITLLANVLISVVIYWLMDLRLHVYSLAGITVSLSLIIDASIVMIEHYSYYRDRSAFLSILAAMLTTIGALILIFFMPDYIREDLTDFAWIVIVNLSVSLVVALLFVPPLVDVVYGTQPQQKAQRRRPSRMAARLSRLYGGYLRLSQRRWCRWACIVLWAAAFGISLWKFIGCLDTNTYAEEPEEMQLHIRGQMPQGGTAAQLNEKVRLLEQLLSTMPELRRWETYVGAEGAYVTVRFKPEALGTSAPYRVENQVISRVISIGGADWSTSGVSQRGFSNSLNLQYRGNHLELSGYNYERLYRYCEDLAKQLKSNPRVMDLMIVTPGHEEEADELYVEWNRANMALYGVTPTQVHDAVAQIISSQQVGNYRGERDTEPHALVLRSRRMDTYSLWQLRNSQLRLDDGRSLPLSEFLTIERRHAQNVIPRRNQQYVLRVDFNVLGSYVYTERYIKEQTQQMNDRLPVGYRCQNTSWGWYDDTGEQYWLLGIVVAVIFFLCAVLFESLLRPLVIIGLIPCSFIGVFLVFWLTGVPFGTGGFASMVLLCGTSVNAGIYLLSQFDYVRRRRPSEPRLRAYASAFNHKIMPILLTIFSTVLGLIPFLLGGLENKFWFSFAVGTMGGLAVSLLALVGTQPLFLSLRKRKKR